MCDVHLTLPDRICFFGFHDESELEMLETGSSDWQIAGDALVQPVAKLNDGVSVKVPFTSAMINADMRGLPEATDGITPRVGVFVSGSERMEPSPGGVFCDIAHRFLLAPGARLFRATPFEISEGDLERGSSTIRFQLAAATQIEGKPSCTADHGSDGAKLGLENFAPPEGLAGVFIDQGTIEIRSIQIISLAP